MPAGKGLSPVTTRSSIGWIQLEILIQLTKDFCMSVAHFYEIPGLTLDAVIRNIENSLVKVGLYNLIAGN